MKDLDFFIKHQLEQEKLEKKIRLQNAYTIFLIVTLILTFLYIHINLSN